MHPASAKQAHFPERVGKYELILPIGTGGMATVYLGRTQGAGGAERSVALKLVHAHLRADEESKLHLLEEAKLAALIRHPNVIRVLEVGEDPIGVFLVMEYIDGETLSGLIRLSKAMGRPMSRRLMARVLNDALLGLHAAHELRDPSGKPLNLVHRDFSPQNILVSVHGQTRLGDFGVAKAADRAVRTKTGLTKGKIAYMSPEQARGHGVDRRCDVWAAGIVAWELLAGERIHKSEDDVATLLSIVTERPPRLSSVLDDLPPKLDDAIARALEPQLDERCKTAEELRQTLDDIWNAGDGIADALELGKFVREVSREQRATRQRLVDEIRASRQAEGSRPSGSIPATPRRRLSSGPVLVTGDDANDAVGDELISRIPETQSDPHATRQDIPSSRPSAAASGTNHDSPSGPNTSRRAFLAGEEDPAFAATNAAVLAPTPDPGAPQSSIQPSEAALRAMTGEDSAPVHTQPQRTGMMWDEEAHYEAETRVIPDAERQLRDAGLLPAPEDRTETSAVVPTWEEPRRRSRWALLMAAVLGATGSATVAWLLQNPEPEPTAATEVVNEAVDTSSPERAAEKSETEQDPERQPDEANATDTPELATQPSAEPAPNADTAAAARRVTNTKRSSPKKRTAKPRPSRSPKASQRPVRDKPKLATSPYGEPKSGQ